MANAPLVARFDDMDWTPTPAGAREKRLATEGHVLRLVEFPEGFEEPEPCVRGHSGYCVSGTGELETTEGTTAISPGTALLLPEGSPHRLRPGAGGCVLLLAERG